MGSLSDLLVAYFVLLFCSGMYLGWLVGKGRRRNKTPSSPSSPASSVSRESERGLEILEELNSSDNFAIEDLQVNDTVPTMTPMYDIVDDDSNPDTEKEKSERLNSFSHWTSPRFWRARCMAYGVFGKASLPRAILLISFLNSFVQSFPINFFGKFITAEIGMTPTQFQQYYAFTFLPFSFKPIYAYVFENVTCCGSSSRKMYLILCNTLIAVCMFFMATVATEVWHVFVIGFLQNVFEAASGMVVGLVVIDIASQDELKIPKLQAEQTMARYLGTFCALLLALPVSGCFSRQWENRTALLVSSMIPLVAAAVGCWVPPLNDRAKESAAPHPTQTGEESQRKTSLERKAIFMFVPTIVLFEVLAIAVGIKGNLEAAGLLDLWRILVISSAAVLVSYVAGCVLVMTRMGDAPAVRMFMQISVPCIYLFLVDAVPSSLEGVMSFKYHVFSNQCELQGLSLLSTVSQIAGMSLFACIFVGVPVEVSLLMTTMISATIGLLDIVKTLPSFTSNPFGIWLVVDVFGGGFQSMFLLAKETLATQFSFALKRSAHEVPQEELEEDNFDSIGDVVDIESSIDDEQEKTRTAPGLFSPGILYSIYLTCFDIGGSASGFISAAIISSLGITSTDFTSLGVFIALCSIAFLLTVVLLPTVRYARLS